MHAADSTTDPPSQSVDVVSLTLPSERSPSTHRWRKSLYGGFLALGLTLTAAFSLSIAILAYYNQSIAPAAFGWLCGIVLLV
jgi:hypothetical protein